MMRIDESGHDDAAARVDHGGTRGTEVWTDGLDLPAFYQQVGFCEVTYGRVHRHDVAAANDVAAPIPAAVPRGIVVLRCGRTLTEQAQSRDGRTSRCRDLQEIPA
jgi:hypothetical protein